jgi:hypothetical protein
LERLLGMTRRYDAGGMEEAMSKLERYAYERGNELIKWLREKMDDLEYKEIESRLENEIKIAG